MTERRRYRLVRDTISEQTIECLRQLLAEAEAGEIIGIAYAAMRRRREFIINSAGEAHASPTFAIGMVHMLAEQLSAQVKGD